MQDNRNTVMSLLLLSGLFFLCGFTINYFANRTINPKKYADRLEAALHQQEDAIQSYFRDADFLENAINDRLPVEQLKELDIQAYTLCIYRADSLVFWSNNKALPYSTEIDPTQTRVSKMVKLQKGRYQFVKDRYTAADNKTYTLIALIPVYYEYATENNYFQNGFAESSIPKYVNINPKGTRVRTTAGQPLFHITVKDTGGKQRLPRQALFFYLSAFFMVVMALTYFCLMVIRRYDSWVGVPLFVGLVAVVRLLASRLGFTSSFAAYDLFDPKFYALNDWMNSLGDLFINVILLFWVSVFVHRNLRFRHIMSLNTPTRYTLAAVGYATIFGLVFLMGFVYRSLVLNSEISLEIDNIFSLNIYSLIGLLSMTVMAAAFFFLTHKLILLIDKLNLEISTQLALGGIGLAAFTVLNVFNVLPPTSLFLIFFAALIIVLFNFFTQQKSLTLGWLFGWIIVFSVFSSILLFQLNNEKNLKSMKFYAERLSEDSDHAAEMRLNEILADIRRDNIIKSFFKNPILTPRKQITDRIERRYIKGYIFNHYNYHIHTYNKSGKAVRGEEPAFESIIGRIDAATPTGTAPELYLWSDGRNAAQYIAMIPILDDGNTIGKFVIEFLPKALKKSNVYPELLLDNHSKNQQKFDAFDYSIYRNGSRIKQKDKSFSEQLEFDLPKGAEFATERRDGRQYLIHRPNAEKVVVVASAKRDLMKPISLFSYMFCLQFAVFLLLIFINRLIQALPKGMYRISIGNTPSLRSRINASVISVIVLSFIAIGAITVIYFQQEFQEYHQGRLERKVRGVLATAKSEMQEHPASIGFLPNVNKLSDIHNMDINLYGLDGALIESSQKEIFDRGLISKKIDPVALHYLRNKGMEQYTQDERINTLEYLSAYVPLYNVEQERVAYLGLPYFSRQSNLRQDVSDFMGELLNVFVGLFLVAAMVALFVGNSVTRPIVTIGEKLKQVKLGKKNEPITWENEDEIGELVTEYNKMIAELEKSARLLAQSNRELAWREMARQVAHEIKNPLTPMRLSIQHMQRVYQTSEPEQVNRLFRTILEQIDNLSHIASEFSNFAKMPQAKSEYFVLDDLVVSVYDLFKERENIDFSLAIPDENTTVLADKKQMMRVFNNLIKNAIQAIPEFKRGKIDVIMERLDETVVVKIVDNGVGIPEEKQSSIFVPNFTTKSSGTGLGLAISRNIVENANGSIFFETEEHVGTTFYVELPIQVQAQVASTSPTVSI